LVVFEQYKHLTPEELVTELYEKFETNFIHYIKGIFTVVLLKENKFQIFSDRHSIKRYFIFQNQQEFFISNSLQLISENCTLDLSNENLALFSLTSHFFNGNTLFNNLYSNQPAQLILFSNGILNITSYWHPKKIFTINSLKYNKKNYTERWSKIIASYIEYFKPQNSSLTLTGGNDSRMILSALLNQKHNFHSFTFGNPLSYDGYITKKIIKEAKLHHNFYFTEEPTQEWFSQNAKKIIQFGQGLINIHRAHRNDAIEKEKKTFNTDMVFTGLVGGEYYKEPSYDDVTIPAILKKLLKTKIKRDALNIISGELQNKGFNVDKVNLDEVYLRIDDFLQHAQGLPPPKKKFIYTYLFYGCSHHTQDSNVFNEHIRYVINPFMDIDFIELISSHPKWYVNKKFNLLNRLFHSQFFAEVTHNLAPELSSIPYAKKGKYTANDIVNNKFIYLLKRLSYKIKKDKELFPENFPMGYWLFLFCKEELNKLSPEIESLVNLNLLKNCLEQLKTKTTEKNWHIVTNPINWNLTYEYFKKN
jgi:asparagine synthetase B (glutamine-hydrolysing)